MIQKELTKVPELDGIDIKLLEEWESQGPLDVEVLFHDKMLTLYRDDDGDLIPFKVSKLTPYYHNGVSQGQLGEENVVNGVGRAVLPNEIYEGQFYNGDMHGWCRHIYVNEKGVSVDFGWYDKN